MTLKKKEGQWWIIDGQEEYGPYDNKEDARSDLRGLERFYSHIDDRKFFTTEKNRKGNVSKDTLPNADED